MRAFNKIRTAYLEDMINDPEVMESVRGYDWIRLKGDWKSEEWTEEFANKAGVRKKDCFDFGLVCEYMWNIDVYAKELIGNQNIPGIFCTGAGWQGYWSPSRKVYLMTRGRSNIPSQDLIDKALIFIERDPSAAGSWALDDV